MENGDFERVSTYSLLTSVHPPRALSPLLFRFPPHFETSCLEKRLLRIPNQHSRRSAESLMEHSLVRCTESYSSLNTHRGTFSAVESFPRLENGSPTAFEYTAIGEKSCRIGWKSDDLTYFFLLFSEMFHETIREPFHSDCYEGKRWITVGKARGPVHEEKRCHDRPSCGATLPWVRC